MTKVISHRGANKLAPQNTVPAFQKALEFGVDGFENDVHLTKDGRLVVCHNYDIDRTSNGTGLIQDLTFDELRKFDFGSYFSEEFAGTKIPSLEEFLDLCKSLSVINIEIKSPKKPNTDIARKVINMVKDFNLFENLIISSFDEQILLDCKEVDPKTRTGMLYAPDEGPYEAIFEDKIAFAKKYNIQAYHPFAMFVDEEYIQDCHKIGVMVNPWTVNPPEAMETLRDWGCDGIITDYPDVAMKITREVK